MQQTESGDGRGGRLARTRWFRSIALLIPVMLLALAGMSAPRPTFATVQVGTGIPTTAVVSQIGCTTGGGFVSLSASPTSAAVNTPITFFTGSTGAQTYVFQFGDGLSTPTATPTTTHVYQTGGTYTATVTSVVNGISQCGSTVVTISAFGTGLGCTSSGSFSVTVTANPSFSAPNTNVSFFASSSINGSLYSWNFGDGQTTQTPTPSTSHFYSVGGTFTASVSVIASGLTGCGSTVVTISGAGTGTGCTTVSAFPINVNASPNPAGVGATVTFFANTSLSASFFFWTFGDGQTMQTSTLSTTHVYSTAGTFTATVNASGSGTTGCGSTTVSVGTNGIGSGSSTVQVVSEGPYTGTVNIPVTFHGVAQSLNGASAITTFTWSFGDGSSGTGQQVSHTYTSPGTFNVSLTAADTTGASNTVSTTAVITSNGTTFGNTGTGSAVANGVTANTNGPYSGSSGSPISFNATASTTNSGASIVSYTWSFGDGTSSSGQQVQHTYNSNGSDTVALTVTDTSGAVVTATTTATIGGGLAGGSRTVSLVTGCNNVASTFTNSTQPSTVANGVSPQANLLSVWELVDPSTTKYRGYFPNAAAASDLTAVNRLDAVFICVNGPATLSEPAV